MRFSRLQSVFLLMSLWFGVGLVAINNAPTALAQVTTAAIHGTVTDLTGAALPNAKVTATNTATGITTATTSNRSGFYTFTALQIGPYRVDVELTGFERFESSGIALTANADLEITAS